MTYSHDGAVPSHELATAIVSESARWNVDPILVTSIIVVESGGRPGAFNAKSRDYGLMQINHKTATAMGINTECLMNWQCNLKSGIKIVTMLQKHKSFEPCMYNTGAAGSKRNNGKNCLHYQQKLDKIMLHSELLAKN